MAGDGALILPDLLGLTVAEAIQYVTDMRKIRYRLEALRDVGLGYLTLCEATPSLSAGEAQRLNQATELGKKRTHTLFVFDEPTVGLHPDDVRVLIDVLQRLLDQGGTLVVIEHNLDMMANADYFIDMGPGGGTDGRRIIATGTPQHQSGILTGLHVTAHLQT